MMVADNKSILPPMVAASGAPLEPRAGLIRKTILVVLASIAVLFGLSAIIDGLAPPFSRAVVQAHVVRIAPKVAGRIIEVNITDNDYVEAGRVLFRIDPRPYQISVIEAQAEVERVGQALGLSTATLIMAQAIFVKAIEELANIKSVSERTLELVQHGIFAKSKGEAASAALDAGRASVVKAEADLAKSWVDLGPRGKASLELSTAIMVLERATLELIRTTVTAPTTGLVSNLQLAAGQFVGARQTVTTLIDPSSMWILAQFNEDDLGYMAVSSHAEVVFDASPGSVFAAEIKNIATGVLQKNFTSSVQSHSGGPSDPRLSNVHLILADKRSHAMRFGSRADVVVYVGRSQISNALGYAWVRIISVLNYVR